MIKNDDSCILPHATVLSQMKPNEGKTPCNILRREKPYVILQVIMNSRTETSTVVMEEVENNITPSDI